MLDRLTLDDFTPRLSQPFRVAAPGGIVELVLVQAAAAGTDRAGGRAPFSLGFRGPLQPVLPQAIYPFEHPALGRLEIFIVPVGPEGGGMMYEAIFS